MTQEKFTLKTKNVPNMNREDLPWIIYTGIGYVLGFGGVFLAAFIPGVGDEVWRGVLLILGALLIISSWISEWMSTRKERQYVVRAVDLLAKANGLTIINSHKPIYDKKFYPAIADVGRWAKDLLIASGSVFDRQVSIVAHSYWDRLSPFKRTHLLYVKVDFDKILPHMVLQTRNEKDQRFITALGRTFDDNQRVSLQNNLDSYFIFYTHRRTVTDALAILSPQLLEQLRELDCGLSMEAIGKSLYFYVHVPDVDPIDLKQNMTFVSEVVQSVERSLRVDFLKLPNDEKYPYLRSRPTGGVVNFAGKYFNYAAVFLIGHAIWNIFRLFINKGSEIYEFRWWIASGLVLMTIILIAYLRVQRNKYTRVKQKTGY